MGSPPEPNLAYELYEQSCAHFALDVLEHGGIDFPPHLADVSPLPDEVPPFLGELTSPQLLAYWIEYFRDAQQYQNHCTFVTIPGQDEKDEDVEFWADYDLIGIARAGMEDAATTAAVLEVPLDQLDLGSFATDLAEAFTIDIQNVTADGALIAIDWGDESEIDGLDIALTHTYESMGVYVGRLLVFEGRALHVYDFTVLVGLGGTDPNSMSVSVAGFPSVNWPGAIAPPADIDIPDIPPGSCYADFNYNGIPDCDPDDPLSGDEDCNTNGIHDAADLSYGFSEDCDGNLIPDDCDPDWNEDGIPNACDCNNNGVTDSEDIAGGASEDLNNNGVPDECECDLVEQAKLTASDAQADDAFGQRISLSNDVVLIAAPYDDDYGLNTGAAYVFRYNGVDWIEEAKLTTSDAAAGDEIGSGVSISGNVAVVGAHGDDDYGDQSGAAYVFRYNSVDWIEEAKLMASDAAAGDRFGFGAAVSGDAIVVGAWQDDDHGEDCGAAYVFRHNGSTWVEEAKLTASDAAAGDRFGSVAIDGNVILVGAMYDDDNGLDTGSAYVFRYNGSSWPEEAKLAPSDAEQLRHFGRRVSVDGDRVAVGGERHAVHVFRFNGGVWAQEAQLTPSDSYHGDYLGPVDITDNMIVVGAPSHYLGSDSYVGTAYLYRFNAGRWLQTNRLTASDAAEGDNFGRAVATDGVIAMIGAVNDWPGGSVYVVNVPFIDGDLPDCNTNGVLDDCDIADGTSGDCNLNGMPDECEITMAMSLDCNTNGVPDECDLADGASKDCNGNGDPDECDIADGLEDDCNTNGVPDDCDLSAQTSQDCNTNGIPDECDIADGLEEDCNLNIIPDACELASGAAQDCNTNGLPDDCDVADGTSEDCNTNDVPDECDLAAGTSEDCNENLVPDECDPNEDCNTNGTQDICDVAAGTSEDCNFDEIPDECQPDEDCNTNGIRDICDLGAGTSEDCDDNLVPDECDPDCNTNGIPDPCDITDGTSQDVNSNGLPDECETVMRVRSAAPDGGTGLSWTDPFNSLVDALALIADPNSPVDEIWVAEGTYTPAPPGGDRHATFALINGVDLYGGFAGNETQRDQRNPAAHVTTLSGDLNGDDDPAEFPGGDSYADNTHHIITAIGPDLTATVDGFTITGGNTTGGSPNYGAGVNASDADLTFDRCTFTANQAQSGAAVYAVDNTTTFHRCRFIGNNAVSGGGVMQASRGLTEFLDCALTGNTAGSYGPAFFGLMADNTWQNCTIAHNQTAGSAGSLHALVNGATITGCVFWNNSNSAGTDETAQIGGDVTAIDYCCVQGWTGTLGGTGNLGDDPQFVDSPGPDGLPGTIDDDLRLQADSPGINAADPSYTPDPGATDLAGLPRMRCARVDLGAYESGLGDYDCNQTVDLDDFAHWPACMTGPQDAGSATGCEAFDFVTDNNIDLADFARFMQALSNE